MHYLSFKVPINLGLPGQPQRERLIWREDVNLREANIRSEHLKKNIRARRKQIGSQANNAEIRFLDPGESLVHYRKRFAQIIDLARKLNLIWKLSKGQNKRSVPIHLLAA